MADSQIFTESDKKATEKIVFLLAGLILLGAVATALLNYIDSLGLPEGLWSQIVDYFLQYIWPIWKIIAFILSLLALAGIIYNSWQIRAINLEERPIFNPTPEEKASLAIEESKGENEKWKNITKRTSSSNPSDWRLAIIEADVILGDLLRSLGYQGESIGEILKSLDKSDFLPLDEAWEAHRVRNSIAHGDSRFALNERETKRIIGLYERVFREFGLI